MKCPCTEDFLKCIFFFLRMDKKNGDNENVENVRKIFETKLRASADPFIPRGSEENVGREY